MLPSCHRQMRPSLLPALRLGIVRMLAGLWMAFAILFALPARAQDETTTPLTIFAAASLKTALDALTPGLERTARRPVRLVLAGTPQLARQIEQGAPTDLIITADTDWMDWLATRRLIEPATRADLLGNRLVFIAPRPAAAPLPLDTAGLTRALGRDGRLALAEPHTVPAGRYAKAALSRLGLWDTVAARLAPTENVRVALAYVARGEAPLGIVYASDAAAEPAIAIVATLPDDSHPPIRYPAAQIAGRPAILAEAASRALAYLRGPEAAVLFARQGFVPMTGR